jgi:hypothetical protein
MWKLIEHWLDTIIPKFEQEVGALQDFEQNQRDIKSEYPLFLEAIARTQSFLLGIVFARDLRREATGTGNWSRTVQRKMRCRTHSVSRPRAMTIHWPGRPEFGIDYAFAF